jgi:hypothetical protein
MKKYNYLSVLALSVFFAFASCKKSEDQLRIPAGNLKSNLAGGTHLPLTVVTIAGDPIQTGFRDGAGNQARFYYPFGIDVAGDGTIYVADEHNNKIRKITPPNIVSTINIPAASDGVQFIMPAYVRVSTDGTLNIFTQNINFTRGMERAVWILKPDGTLITPLPPSPYGGSRVIYSGLEKEPYGNFFWFTQEHYYFPDYSPWEVPTALKKFYTDTNGRIGTAAFFPPRDSLALPERNTTDYSITNLYCGYNSVKYLVINHNHIYKLTPSGVFTQIYKDLKFNYIFSLTGSKDNHILYVADKGTIKSIVNGKLQFLVGPQNYGVNAVDGVGSSANVFAFSIVLSQDENTLYFSDHSTIRKLLLK